MDPVYFWTLAGQLAIAVADALEAQPLSGGRPGRVVVTFGEIALDGCDCGILTIALGRRAEYVRFPIEVTSTETRSNAATSACARSPMQDFTLHLARCQPSLGSRGEAPAVDALIEAARVAAVDTEVVRCALLTVLAEWERDGVILNAQVLASQPQGPEGGCGGYVTPFTIGL